MGWGVALQKEIEAIRKFALIVQELVRFSFLLVLRSYHVIHAIEIANVEQRLPKVFLTR